MNNLPEGFRRAMLRGPTLRTNDQDIPPRNPKLPVKGAGQEHPSTDAGSSKLEPGNEPANVGSSEAQKGNPKRFLVRITSVRKRLLDEDNLCEKYVVDCCRYAGLLPNDSPATTRIETTQRKVEGEEPEKTIVEIYEL